MCFLKFKDSHDDKKKNFEEQSVSSKIVLMKMLITQAKISKKSQKFACKMGRMRCRVQTIYNAVCMMSADKFCDKWRSILVCISTIEMDEGEGDFSTYL